MRERAMLMPRSPHPSRARCAGSPRVAGVALTLAMIVAHAACVPIDADADADAGADGGGDTSEVIEVVVGGGDDETGVGFVDWSTGQVTPPMIRGPQGGQHVWVAVRTRGLWPAKMRINVTMTLLDTGVAVKPGTVPLMPTLTPAEDGWHTVDRITAYVKCPCQVKDRLVRVSVETVDLYGLSGAAEATIRPTWDGDCSQPPAGNCDQQ